MEFDLKTFISLKTFLFNLLFIYHYILYISYNVDFFSYVSLFIYLNISVLKSFKLPGTPMIRIETAQFLFQLCCIDENGNEYVSEENRKLLLIPHLFIDLIFGFPKTDQEKKIRGITEITKVETMKVEKNEGKVMRGFINQLNSGRDVVGTGPIKITKGIDSLTEKDKDLLVVPLRFVSSRSRNSMLVPSNFDVSLIKRSNAYPLYKLVRFHVNFKINF